MEHIPMITVRVDEHGALVDVDIEGQPKQTELVETRQSSPIAPFGDEEFKESVRHWLAAG